MYLVSKASALVGINLKEHHRHASSHVRCTLQRAWSSAMLLM